MADDALAEVPFEQIVKIRKTDSSSVRISKAAAARRGKIVADAEDGEDDNSDQPKRKKRTKSAPAELTAKRPVSRRRVVITNNTPSRCDPRFDKRLGQVNKSYFERSYAFLEEIKDQELQQLNSDLYHEHDSDKKQTLQKAVELLQQRKISAADRKAKAEQEREAKKIERQKVLHGKKPYFQRKKSTKKTGRAAHND